MQNISKMDAARRQISVAIDLILNDGDIVSAHTLAGAASNILFDLVEHQLPNNSIEKKLSSKTAYTTRSVLSHLREPQNFLKHARDDPQGEYSLDPNVTEQLLMSALKNLDTITDLSKKELTYVFWQFARGTYLATNGITPMYEESIKKFPELENKSRLEQLQIGKAYIKSLEA